MDELRIALIIAGIVLVAVVYFVSARDRRRETQAGEFDPAGAWPDDSVDPLLDDVPDRGAPAVVDALEATAINPAVARMPVDESSAPKADAQAEGSSEAPVIANMDVIANSLDDTSEPQLGSLEAMDSQPESLPVPEKPKKRGTAKQKTAAPGKAATKASGKNAKKNASKKSPDSTARSREQGDVEPLAIVINIMARDGARFPGVDVEAALQEAGLRFGEMQLYHFRSETQPAGTLPIFTALNMVKPGTLSPEEFPDMQTPGIAMVLRLPGEEAPAKAFELMHKASRSVAEYLGGTLCDESRSHLTPQALNHLREQITEYSRKLRIPTD